MLGGVVDALCAFLWMLIRFQISWNAARQLRLPGISVADLFNGMSPHVALLYGECVLQPYDMAPIQFARNMAGGMLDLGLAGILGSSPVQVIVASLLSLSFANTHWRWGCSAVWKTVSFAMLHLSFAWLSVVYFALHAVTNLGYAIDRGHPCLSAPVYEYHASRLRPIASALVIAAALQAGNLL